MRVSPVEIGLLAGAAVVVAVALPRCSSGAKTTVVRASWALTPGALNPAVTQATIRTTICRRGWTRTIRPPVSYTNALKARQLEQYRLRGPLSAFQEDQPVAQVARCVPVRRARVVPGFGRPADQFRESRLVTGCCHDVATNKPGGPDGEPAADREAVRGDPRFGDVSGRSTQAPLTGRSTRCKPCVSAERKGRHADKDHDGSRGVRGRFLPCCFLRVRVEADGCGAFLHARWYSHTSHS